MILLFGGTSDSIVMMEQLEAKGYDVKLSVATNYGKIFSEKFGDRVMQKRLTQEEMEEFIQQHHIQVVVDASHPFADIVSSNAIAAATSRQIPYIRFERPRPVYPPFVEMVTSLEAACDVINATLSEHDSIYLTTGSKTLKQYAERLPIKQLTARVLPTAEVIESCEAIGFTADQIHGIKGPFDVELSQSLFKQRKATIMVTKESGVSGGMAEKIAAAEALNMRVIIIERPHVQYPNKYESIEETVQAIERFLREKGSS